MNLVDLLAPASLDAKQALRLRRFGVAALNYVLATTLATIAWAFGVLPGPIVIQAAAAFLVINLGVYAVIRSGVNLRFTDPSLTRFQMMAAISVLMYIVYHMDHGRDVALFGCFIVFLFGVFRLEAREFIGVTLFTLAAHALVINLLMHLRPEAIHDVPSEWMSWVGLAGFLPCFVIIGGQINALRRGLRERVARSRNLAEMSSDFYWETDAEHRLVDRSVTDGASGAASMFHRGVQIGERRWEIPYLSPDEAGWAAHRAVLGAHRPFREFENSRLGVDGTERHISLSGDPLFDASGEFIGYRGVGVDITARKRAEQALRESAHQLRMFADSIPAMTVSWDENLRCKFANQAFSEFFGVAAERIVGRHVREISGEEVYREIEAHYAQALQGYPATYQRTRKLKNGEARYLEVRLFPSIGEKGNVQGCFSVTTDITEHKRAEERSRHLAHHDSLTGLPNRLLFHDRLAQEIALAKRSSRQFALLFLDLDKFKAVNDSLGHNAGDELLKAVATRIRQQVRESDTVARVGGDEFTVILPNTGRRDQAEVIAGKIITALTTPFMLSGRIQSVEIGTSVGIAIYPDDARDADELVKAADAAMYLAKQSERASLPAAQKDQLLIP